MVLVARSEEAANAPGLCQVTPHSTNPQMLLLDSVPKMLIWHLVPNDSRWRENTFVAALRTATAKTPLEHGTP